MNDTDRFVFFFFLFLLLYAQGDSDVISTPAGFRRGRHLVGMTLINVFHCNIAEIS